MANISLEEAKAMVSHEAIEKLKEVVSPKQNIDTSSKVNNDIIMAALCTAVGNGVIKPISIDERMVKLLNSSTNTVSANKLGNILSHIRITQPDMVCVITLKSGDMSKDIADWVFTGPSVYFNKIFEYVIDKFEITPSLIRTEMVKMLKTTIVNNVAQFVAKYSQLTSEEAKRNESISISTITRLVNMSNHLLVAEFKEMRN
jgi:hypothetical protein